MRQLLSAVAVLALAACASEPTLVSTTAPTVVASQNTELTAQTKLVCHKESAIGSQMLHTVCEAPQSEADREATQRALRANNPMTQRAAGAGG